MCIRDSYRVPSGMGGVFIVKILHEVGGDKVRVRIHMPGNPDFHGHVLVVNREALTPE